MSSIHGKTVWILGASSGIGRALAEHLARADNFVIVTARSELNLRELAALYPGKIKILAADFSQQLDLNDCRKQLLEITDYLDIAIYCAGLCDYEDDFKFDPDKYLRSMDINLVGAVRCLNLALPLFKKNLKENRPQFAVISSLSTQIGFPRAEAYGASKAALNYFMESLRADFSKLPIDLSLIKPGFVSTPLVSNNDFPMPLMISSDTAAQIILKGLAKRKFHIDFPLRLSLSLKFLSLFSSFWFGVIAPKLTRLHAWK